MEISISFLFLMLFVGVIAFGTVLLVILAIFMMSEEL
jgi:hypothetical protein